MVKGIKRRSAVAFWLIAIVSAFGCIYDRQHPPYVRNEVDQAIYVTIKYAGNAPDVAGQMAAKSNAGHGIAGMKITGLKIQFKDGTMVQFDEDDLSRLRHESGSPGIEVWLVSREGVQLGGEDEWEKIRAKGRRE